MPTKQESTNLNIMNESVWQDTTNKVENLFKTLSEMPSDFYFDERTDDPPQEHDEF